LGYTRHRFYTLSISSDVFFQPLCLALLFPWFFSLHYLCIAHCSFSTSSFNSLILITVSFPMCHLDTSSLLSPSSTSSLITFKKLASADHPPPLHIPRESGGENRSVCVREREREREGWINEGAGETPWCCEFTCRKLPAFPTSALLICILSLSLSPLSLASFPQYYFTCSIVQQ